VEENGAAKLATALPRFGDCDSNGISEAVGFCLTIARRDAVMTLLSTSLADLALTSAWYASASSCARSRDRHLPSSERMTTIRRLNPIVACEWAVASCISMRTPH